MFFFSYFCIIFLFMVYKFQKILIFHFHVLSTPKVGCFFKIVKILHFCYFITQLVNKLQHRSLYKVIEDVLPYVLNTCMQKSFAWFQKNADFPFFSKINEIVYFNISAINYPSDAVLYWKRMWEYPISLHLRTAARAFLRAE